MTKEEKQLVDRAESIQTIDILESGAIEIHESFVPYCKTDYSRDVVKRLMADISAYSEKKVDEYIAAERQRIERIERGEE